MTQPTKSNIRIMLDRAHCTPLWDVGAPEWTAGVVVVGDGTGQHDGLSTQPAAGLRC